MPRVTDYAPDALDDETKQKVLQLRGTFDPTLMQAQGAGLLSGRVSETPGMAKRVLAARQAAGPLEPLGTHANPLAYVPRRGAASGLPDLAPPRGELRVGKQGTPAIQSGIADRSAALGERERELGPPGSAARREAAQFQLDYGGLPTAERKPVPGRAARASAYQARREADRLRVEKRRAAREGNAGAPVELQVPSDQIKGLDKLLTDDRRYVEPDGTIKVAKGGKLVDAPSTEPPLSLEERKYLDRLQQQEQTETANMEALEQFAHVLPQEALDSLARYTHLSGPSFLSNLRSFLDDEQMSPRELLARFEISSIEDRYEQMNKGLVTFEFADDEEQDAHIAEMNKLKARWLEYQNRLFDMRSARPDAPVQYEHGGLMYRYSAKKTEAVLPDGRVIPTKEVGGRILPAPRNPEEAAGLPVGTEFVTPSGKVMRVTERTKELLGG